MTIATNLPSSLKEQLSYVDRDKLESKIVHLGFGAFHRAHQGLFTNDVARLSGGNWGICEVNLFGGEKLIKNLREQDHLYSVVEKGPTSDEVKIVSVVTESLHSELDGCQAVITKMLEPQVAIVSLTITEKGYCVDPATGRLDKQNSLIVHDLANPNQPKSALGYIVEALRQRKELALAPFTVMSCDNVQENGHVAKVAVLELANLIDKELGTWIEENVSFPCTMVDRIVPAATDETLEQINALLGVADPCGIACEPFRQWVIEDNFVAGRPNWDIAGAEFVSDVVPYEEMKLRMLNGSHSFLAYLGYLGGYDHISDTMTDQGYRKAAFDMMLQAQAPSLKMPLGTDLKSYAEQLIERFTNPSLKHKTWQIAMDGSQKIPQRMGGSLRFHLEKGSEFKWLALGIAGWMRYISAVDEEGQPIDVRDPMAEQLKAICDEHGQKPSVVPALLSLESIFSPDIGKNSKVIDAISLAYEALVDNGARATVAAL